MTTETASDELQIYPSVKRRRTRELCQRKTFREDSRE